MSRLAIALLGPPEISRDGAIVSLDRQKAVALLAYLALTGKRHSREQLAALLWPDQEQARAYANLRQAIWALNSALGPGWIEADRLGVALRADAPVDLDVAGFRADLARARHDPADLDALTCAVARYRGDLLAGLDLRDSAPFAEWLFFEAEALRHELAGALDSLAEGLAARGDLEPAAAAARRRLALDPLYEPAHRRLMRIYLDLGQRGAALRQYEECARILREELDAEPEEETRRLGEEIRRDRPAATPAIQSEPEKVRHQASGIRHQVSGLEKELAGPPVSFQLPAPPTAFVGREDELATIEGLLADPACRLLTLLGPGGIGKTRLAIQAARSVAGLFPDGICFVALASVPSSDLILTTIAAALGLRELRVDGLAAQLADYLRTRHMLIVADNLEHLVDGADQLAGLIEATPDLKILATSRERLGMFGEWTLDVGGLLLPGDGDRLEDIAAGQLFLQAARRARPGLAPDAAEQRAMARICRLVGGVPLALELAAAWIRLMPGAQVSDAIAADLDFLAGNTRGLPERHRGLRAVFEHSWRLLGPAEQATFARLAVFRGGFTMAAAAAVCRSAPAATAVQILALIDKSLVRRLSDERFDLHELLRQYAAERLAADPNEQHMAHAAHAAYYMALLHRLEHDLKTSRQPEAQAVIDVELDNIRAAWRSAVARADREALAAGLESLFHYYESRSLFEEAEDCFGRAAAAATATASASANDEVLLGNLLARQGWFALRLYRFEAARALMRWSLDLLQPHINRPDAIFSSVIANFQAATGGEIASPELLQSQLEYLRAGGDKWNLAFALHSLAVLAPSQQEARTYLLQSLELSQSIGSHLQIARALDMLAGLAKNAGALGQARAYWEESLTYFRALDYRWALAYALDQQGYATRMAGDMEAATLMHQESLTISRAIGDRLGVAGSLDNLGLVALDSGDLDAATDLLHEGLALRQAVGHTGSTAVSLVSLGALLIARGDLDGACQQLGRAEELAGREGWDFMIGRIHHLRARIDRLRGDAAAARAGLARAVRLIGVELSVPDLLTVMLELGAIYLAEGEPAPAVEIAAVALANGAECALVRREAEALLAVAGGPPESTRPLADVAREIMGMRR